MSTRTMSRQVLKSVVQKRAAEIPLCLLSNIYKVITKILTKRLEKMDSEADTQ